MELNNTNTIEILIDKVERETEKAVMVQCPVSWGGNLHTRTFWFPKSCVKLQKKTMTVAKFLIDKLSSENTFHGYQMNFES